MTCQHCGRVAEPDANFCVDCGSPLELRCPACQTRYEPGSRFCSLCGRSLPEAVVSTPVENPGKSEIPEPVSVPQQTESAMRIEEPLQSDSQSFPCPRCRQKNSHDAEYCFACGMPLEEFPGSTPTLSQPSGISVHVPGGFWVRVFAYVIDTVAIILIYFVLAVLYGVYLATTGDDLSDFGEQSFFVYAPFLVRAAYETVLVANWATTLGKRILGLYIIRADSSSHTLEESGAGQGTPNGTEFRSNRSRVGIGRAFARHLATYLSGLILCIGYLQVAFREDKLSLHDQISGTKVVRLNSRATVR